MRTRTGIICLSIIFSSIGEINADWDSRLFLKGLRSVTVRVEAKSCEPYVIIERTVRTDTELPLRQSGIKVSDTLVPEIGNAKLTVSIECGGVKDPKVDAIAFFTMVEVVQFIPWRYQSKVIPVPVTTGRSPLALGIASSKNIEDITRKEIRDNLKEFINIWLSVNPNK